MILIISSEDDKTTTSIQRWLLYLGARYVRINDSTKVRVKKFVLNDQRQEVELILDDAFHKNQVISLNDIKAVWYRRGHINIDMTNYENPEFSVASNKKANEYLYNEKKIVSKAIIDILKEKQSVNSEFDTEINKLIALKEARKNGLSIPATLISGSLRELNRFLTNEQNVITKAVNESGFRTPEFEISGGTEIITDTGFVQDPEAFIFPSQMQENLDKAFELRIFFIFQEYYATAIFSQSNKKTKTEFRNYDFKKPNRVVAYSLPTEIKEKLIKTMRHLNLNCGSIDMVVTKNGRYVFLEVNPVGQFEQVSYPCNYLLERRIAQVLIEIANGKKFE
jgi:ATP-GRASP peptide maturase of grasp-with-spasm system